MSQAHVVAKQVGRLRLGFVAGSHNMLFRLDADRWAADLSKSARADVRGFQESADRPQRRALRRHVRLVGHRLYQQRLGLANAVAWNPATFDRTGVEFSKFVHGSAIAAGLRARFNPARYVVGVGLVHRLTGKRILFVTVHATAGATKPEPNEFGPALNAWKDLSIERYWLTVVQIVAKAIRSGDWDAIVLLGDFNANYHDDTEWYYPARMLAGLFSPDSRERGYDHIVATWHSSARIVRRWTLEGFTDHSINFAEIKL